MRQVAIGCLLLGLLAFGGGLAEAVTVEAWFNDGATSTEVDGYPGIGNAGGEPDTGWYDKWREAQGWGAYIVREVLTTNPLDTGGGNTNDNYFHVTATGSPSQSYGSVTHRRAHNGYVIDRDQDHTVSFRFRIDENIKDSYRVADRYAINGCLASTGSGGETNHAGDTFELFGLTDATSWSLPSDYHWYVHNGQKDGSLSWSNLVDTNVPLEQGGVYDVTATLHPSTQTYDMDISATVLGTPYTYSNTGLGWRTSATTATNSIKFAARMSGGGYLGGAWTREYSVDSVVFEGSAPPMPSTVVAHFDGGQGTTAPDGFAGIAGNGWYDPWKLNKSDTVTYTGTVTETNPVDTESGTTDNYLQIVSSGPAEGYGTANISRAIVADSVDRTQVYYTSFKFRIDEDISQSYAISDRYSITGGMGASDQRGGTFAPLDNWHILGLTDAQSAGLPNDYHWYVVNDTQDGTFAWTDDIQDTGIAMVEDGVYEFLVKTDPTTNTCDITISDGTTTVTKTNLGYRSTSGAEANMIKFAHRITNETREYSIDSIVISNTAPVQIPGDADDDGDVDKDDLAAVAGHWGAGPGAVWSDGDFDGDGYVGPKDASILSAHWTGSGGEANPVPEPGTLILLGIGALMLLPLRRRNK